MEAAKPCARDKFLPCGVMFALEGFQKHPGHFTGSFFHSPVLSLAGLRRLECHGRCESIGRLKILFWKQSQPVLATQQARKPVGRFKRSAPDVCQRGRKIISPVRLHVLANVVFEFQILFVGLLSNSISCFFNFL